MERVKMLIFLQDISKTGVVRALIKHEIWPPVYMAHLSIFQFRIVANGELGVVLTACQFMYLKWILESIALALLLAIVKAIVLVCIPWFDACPESFF